jgi:hypothetical protein
MIMMRQHTSCAIKSEYQSANILVSESDEKFADPLVESGECALQDGDAELALMSGGGLSLVAPYLLVVGTCALVSDSS